MSTKLNCYFKHGSFQNKKGLWPISEHVLQIVHASADKKNQPLNLENDVGLESMFDITSLPAYRMKVKAKYPQTAMKALKIKE